MAISTRWLPSPVTRPAHSPSIVARPSSSRPSSRKKSIVPPRSSTTIPTLSIRLSAICPIYKAPSTLTTDPFSRQFLVHDLAPALFPARWHTVYETELEMWRLGWDDEGALREKVAERNRQPEEDCTRLRPRRGVEMGQALLHLPEKERGDHHPAKGRLRALVLQRRLAQVPEAHVQEIGHAQAGRWIKVASPKEISALQAALRSYIYEAIEVEQSGKKVP